MKKILFITFYFHSFLYGQDWSTATDHAISFQNFIDSAKIPCRKTIWIGNYDGYKGNEESIFALFNKLNKECGTRVISFNESPTYEYVYYRYTKFGIKKLQSPYGSLQVYLKSVYNYFDYVDITTRSNLSRSSYNIETDFQNGIYVLSDIIMESGKKFLFMKEFDVCAEIYFKQEKIRDQISRLINIFELDENRYKENLTRIEYYFYSKMIKHCKQGLTFMNLFENGKQNDAYNFENLCKSQNVSEVIKSSQGQVIIVTENENVLNSYIIDKDGEAYIEESLLSTAMAIDHFDCLKIGTINYDLAYEDIEWTKMGKDKQGNLRQKKSKRVVLNCKGVKWIGNNDFDFLIIGK